MDYSLHYDDELTITGTFAPTTTETQAFEFLEFFKEHARIDPFRDQQESGENWIEPDTVINLELHGLFHREY